MRKLFALTAALVLAATLRLSSTSTLYANVDWPYQGIVEPANQLYVGGWALNCNTGQIPTFTISYLYNYDTGQNWLPANIQLYSQLYRPDVYNVFASTCPLMTPYVGYQMYFSPTPPDGRYRMWVSWAELDGSHVDQPIEVTLRSGQVSRMQEFTTNRILHAMRSLVLPNMPDALGQTTRRIY